MQAQRQPCSSSPSTKVKITRSRTPKPEIRVPSSVIPPIDVLPGGIRPDSLLLVCNQASLSARGQANVHHYDNHTFVHPCHSFQTSLSVHLEEDESSASRCGPRCCRGAFLTSLVLSENPGHALDVDVKDRFLKQGSHHARYHPTQPPRRRLFRSLTTHSLDTIPGTMELATCVPGSPPDLTDSRSSKSSSSESNFSGPGEVLTEITHFEDIGLDDAETATNRFRYPSEHSPKGSPRAVQDAPYYRTQKPSTSRLPAMRSQSEFTSQRSLVGGPLQRVFTNSSTTNVSARDPRQRSRSPPNKLPRSASTISLSASGFPGPSPRSSFGPGSRRGSWQPRKTVKEIEADYHDSDDDLPEDASLWNVPISPFPSGNRSAFSSAKGSPERQPAQSPQPIPLEHTRSTPDLPPRRSSAAHSVPRHRLSPKPSSNDLQKPVSASPRMPTLLRNGRAKSWNLAMSDLSAEARVLSQNLEIHAESQEHVSNDKYMDKWLPPIPHRSSAPSAIQLPPVQRGALDFMPISKEKEAILSRTRPSWLPPKDPKEERKHLKEYQKMMAASIEAEKKKESKLKNAQTHKDEALVRINRIWDYYVNPSTDIVNIDRRVHDLCWRGIPSRIRGKVWQRTVGNALELSPQTYSRALDRARAIKAKDSQSLSQHERCMLKSFSDIERDAETAFTELKVFHREGPLWQDLINICEAHTCYRSDVGYFYGVQLIGALILLQVPDPADAFVLLENCMNKPVPLAFQTGEIAATQRTYNRVISTLGIKFPRLHDYLFETPERDGLGFTGEELLGTMFRAMFSNGLDIDRLSRVWDIWVFEGDRMLVRTAVAILGSLQSQIFDIQGDLDLKRRNVQEMLGWGPFNRTEKGSYWQLEFLGGPEALVKEIRMAGQLDYTGR